LCISKDSKRPLGYVITVAFEIALDVKDLDTLKGLQSYFGVGGIYKHVGNMMRYKVSSTKDLTNVIIPHFDKYPLLSQKGADFEILKSAIQIINKGVVSPEQLQALVNLRASLNRGLSSNLQALFPETVPVKRRVIPFVASSLHPLWVVGFTEAEGNFYIGVTQDAKSKLGVSTRLRFALTQHSRDEKLLQGFIDFFGCGLYAERNNKLAGDFKVNSFEDISRKIIPGPPSLLSLFPLSLERERKREGRGEGIFCKYPLLGSKSLDLKAFIEAAKIISEKGHLTKEGFGEIERIKAGMNKGRTH